MHHSSRTSTTSAPVLHARLRQWRLLLARRETPAVVLALALFLALPSIAVGFYTDDWTFLVALRSHVRPFFDLFRFSPGDLATNQTLVATGQYPWWTAPDFKLHLIRPLTSMVFALDDRLFGNAPLGYHLDALVWFGALLVGAWLLFKRVLPRGTATLAFLVFGFRSGHVLPYAWLSARHVLIAAVPATFALVAHVRAMKEGWRSGLVLGPLLLVLALCGSEIALGIVPFWVALDGYLAWRKRGQGEALHFVWAAAPAVLAAAVYLAAYKLVGGGAWSSPSYHNPLDAPAAFLSVIPTRIPVLLADALLGIPVVFSLDGPTGLIVLAGLLGVGFVGAMLALCRPLQAREREALAWLLPAALMAMALGVSGPPWGHVLLIPDLAFSVLIGILLRHALDALLASSWRAREGLLALGALVLVTGHLVVAPAMTLLTIHRLAQGSHITENTAMTADIGATSGTRVFVTAATDSMVFFYPRDVLAVQAPGKVDCWSVLSGVDADQEITRTSERSFTLKVTGPMAGDAFKALFFGARHFAVGDAVRQCGAVVEVTALDAGVPSALSVTLDEPLESPDLAFVQRGRDGRLRRVELPSTGATRAELANGSEVVLTNAVVPVSPSAR